MLRLCYNSSVSAITFSFVNMPKYAVACGRIPGVYDTWDECKLQVDGFQRAVYKKFDTKEEAEAYINEKQGRESSGSRFAPLPSLQTVPQANDTLSDPTLQLLVSKVNAIEDKLNKFMGDISTKLNSFSSRLLMIEGKRNASNANLDDNDTDPGPSLKKAKDQYDFNTDHEGFVEVYTDGACSKNGRTGARAGIGVWFGDNHPLNLAVPVKGPATNNNAEIQAARMAVVQAANAGVTKLAVYTDSEFTISCITQWIHRWKKNEWKLSTGGPVKNKDELMKLDEVRQRIETIRWVHVRGHSGVRGNERADELAREGAKHYDPSVTYSNLI